MSAESAPQRPQRLAWVRALGQGLWPALQRWGRGTVRWWPRLQLRPSLRLAISLPLVLLCSSMVLLQAYMQHHTTARLIDEESQLLLRQLVANARGRLDHFLSAPVTAQRGITDAIVRHGLFAQGQIEPVQRHLLGVYQELYGRDAQISAVGFGSAQGDYVGVRRTGTPPVFGLMRKDSRVSDQLLIFSGEDEQKVLATFPNYDPRRRPWYAPSAASGRELWSEVHANRDGMGLLALSNAAPVLRDGVVLGVVAADVTLNGLSRHLAAESERIGGMLYVVDANQLLIATSDSAPLVAQSEQAPRLAAADYAHPVIRASARFLAGNAADFSFSQGGAPYVGHIEPYQTGNGIDWRIVAVLPQAQLLGHAREVNLMVLLGSGLLGLLGLYLIIAVVDYVTRSLKQVADAAGSHALSRIGSLNPRSTRIREAAALMDALSRMAQELQRSFRRLHDSVFSDELTGLLSRRGLAEAVLWTEPRPCMVCLVGIDDLHTVHEVFDHATGELVIRELARRLQAMQPAPVCAARLAGGELLALFELSDPAWTSEALAAQVKRLFDAPFQTGGDSVPARGTLGVVCGGVNRDSLNKWLRRAASALAHGRSQGGACCVVFDEHFLTEAVHRADVLRRLDRALNAGELVSLYQPIIDLATGELVGLEALVRWQDPLVGLVLPSEFLPYAEQTEMIVRIGEQMLMRACQDAPRIHAKLGRWPDMHVNVSARHLLQTGFAAFVQRQLAAAGMPPAKLTLELTESTFISADGGITEPVFSALHALGVLLAIDDFGTGYSSLSYLERLPIAGLKIDKSFVDKLLSLPVTGKALVRAITGVSSALGLETVAEGVESVQQLHALKRLGCHRAQGYLLGKPCAVEALDLTTRRVCLEA